MLTFELNHIDDGNRSTGMPSDFCGRYWTKLEPLPRGF